MANPFVNNSTVPMQPGPAPVLPQSVPNPPLPEQAPSVPMGAPQTAMDALMQTSPTPANPSLAAQPEPSRPGRLKQLLLNMAQGAAIAGGYQAGIPQSQALQAQTAMERAKIPYAGPLARAQTQQAQAEAEMTRQMMQPVTISVPGPDGQMQDRTVPGWLAKILAPQNIRYMSAANVANINANSRSSVAGQTHPQLAILQDAIGALQNGDMETYQQKIAQAQQVGMAAAGRAPVTPSMARWVNTINDPNASPAEKAIAQKNVDSLQNLNLAQAEARGKSYSYYRAMYGWQTVMDPNSGQTVPMQGWQIQALQKQGVPVTASGRLSAKDALAVQQLNSEATPAIEKVNNDLGAYDNASDRAIFARIISEAGRPTYGNEAGWMGNVLNTALKSGLSPQGQALTRDLARLTETVGRFRSVMGAPSTDTQMALAMALLPGGSTPNSQYAREQLNNFKDMVQLGVNVPILRGSQGNGNAPPAKPENRPTKSFWDSIPGAVKK